MSGHAYQGANRIPLRPEQMRPFQLSIGRTPYVVQPRDVIDVHKRQSAGDIIREFARETGIEVSALRGPSAAQVIAYPRQRLMFRLRHSTDLSFAQIGALLGGRDHSTISYGVRAHEARMRGER